MLTLNIIGGGRTGLSLAKLWLNNGLVSIGSVLNRTPQSSERALKHLGCGTPASTINQMLPADLWMITTPDSVIEQSALQLANSGLVKSGDVVFHCSGVHSSEILNSLKSSKASLASIHPIMSFPTPLSEPSSMSGSYCGCEGDLSAIEILQPLFKSIGAICFSVSSKKKALYHAASVLCCNKLTALVEASAQLFEESGVDRELATQLIQPLTEATLANIFKQGTVQALTGPIARGDSDTVEKHLTALASCNPALLEIYKSLGKIACELSSKQGNADASDLNHIHRLLE